MSDAAATRWPRLMSKATAAAYCELSLAAFADWVRKGRLPKRLRGTQRWDRAAIDDALDRVSGRTSRSAPQSLASEFLARYDLDDEHP